MEELGLYFNHSAAFRIMDAPEKHKEIEAKTGLKPTHSHRVGEINSQTIKKEKWENSIWSIESPLNEEDDLTDHLNWLWEKIQPHSEYFKGLIENGIKMDVYCGYRSDCDHAGFDILPESLEIFTQLNIPMVVSVIISVPNGQMDHALRKAKLDLDLKKYAYYLGDLGALVKEYALEAKKDYKKSKGTDGEDFKSGYLMGYHRFITLMQQQAEAFGIKLDEINLHDIKEEDLLV